MELNRIFESTSQQDFDILSQTTYSDRLDICRLKSKKTQQEFVGLILKEKDPQKRKEFFEKRKHSEAIRAFVADGYKGDTLLPETFLGKGEMILTPYAGEYLKDELYNSLSAEEKAKAQKDLATFLNHMHQKAYSSNPILEKIPYFEKLNDTNTLPPLDPCIDSYLDSMLESWKNIADKKVFLELKKLVEIFKKRDKSDEKSVLNHKDLCGANVLYDKKSKKLAVIDFEYARIGNVYNDFCQYAGLGFPKKFMVGVIREYNKLTDKSAHPSPVSLKKLELLWKIAPLNDQACWIIELGRDPKFAYDAFMKKWEKLNQPNEKRAGRELN